MVKLLVGLGSSHFKLGEWTEALATLERARAVAKVALGPEHPEMGYVLSRIGPPSTLKIRAGSGSSIKRRPAPPSPARGRATRQ